MTKMTTIKLITKKEHNKDNLQKNYNKDNQNQDNHKKTTIKDNHRAKTENPLNFSNFLCSGSDKTNLDALF